MPVFKKTKPSSTQVKYLRLPIIVVLNRSFVQVLARIGGGVLLLEELGCCVSGGGAVDGLVLLGRLLRGIVRSAAVGSGGSRGLVGLGFFFEAVDFLLGFGYVLWRGQYG